MLFKQGRAMILVGAAALCLPAGLGPTAAASRDQASPCPTQADAPSLPERANGGIVLGDIDGDRRADRASIRLAPEARASCGFFLVVETHARTLSVRMPQWYKGPPHDMLVSDWTFAEPYVALIVRLDAHRSQVVVARSHSASFANVSLYGIVDGRLQVLRFPRPAYPPDELSLYGGVMSNTQVRCRRGGPLIELSSGGAYPPARRFRRIDYRLVENRFVVVSRTATAKPSLDAGVRPFTGCVVARGRNL